MKKILFALAMLLTVNANAWYNVNGHDQKQYVLSYSGQASQECQSILNQIDQMYQIDQGQNPVANPSLEQIRNTVQTYLAQMNGITIAVTQGISLEEARNYSMPVMDQVRNTTSNVLMQLGQLIQQRSNSNRYQKLTQVGPIVGNMISDVGQLGTFVNLLRQEFDLKPFVGQPLTIDLDLVNGKQDAIGGDKSISNFVLISESNGTSVFQSTKLFTAKWKDRDIGSNITVTITVPSQQVMFSSDRILSNATQGLTANAVRTQVQKAGGYDGPVYTRGGGNGVIRIR